MKKYFLRLTVRLPLTTAATCCSTHFLLCGRADFKYLAPSTSPDNIGAPSMIHIVTKCSHLSIAAHEINMQPGGMTTQKLPVSPSSRQAWQTSQRGPNAWATPRPDHFFVISTNQVPRVPLCHGKPWNPTD